MIEQVVEEVPEMMNLKIEELLHCFFFMYIYADHGYFGSTIVSIDAPHFVFLCGTVCCPRPSNISYYCAVAVGVRISGILELCPDA